VSQAQSIADSLLSGKSLLLLGEPGGGKTTLAQQVKALLELENFTVAIATYSGSQKDLLESIADQLGVDTTISDGNRFKNKTATQLKSDLLKRLTEAKTALIVDDGQRWTSSLRYWLEDVLRSGGLLLVTAWQPPPKDLFTKLPVIELEKLSESDVRALIRAEAETQGVTLSVRELNNLTSRAGSNPAITKRLVSEFAIGITGEDSADHYEYVDGTPLLIVMLIALSFVRFAGLGLGDKALYLIGGMLTLLAMAIRTVLYAANRGSRKL
jgi:energy-coupling factor transporter ATP-binding protein EcfA2